jgi:hypothetical protein
VELVVELVVEPVVELAMEPSEKSLKLILVNLTPTI